MLFVVHCAVLLNTTTGVDIAMPVETVPLPLPPTLDASRFEWFGREVKGVDPNTIDPESEQFREIEELLYKARTMMTSNVRMHVNTSPAA